MKKGEEAGAANGAVVEFERPEKDDQAANALLSLGCSLPRRASKPKPVAVPVPGNTRTGLTPPRTIVSLPSAATPVIRDPLTSTPVLNDLAVGGILEFLSTLCTMANPDVIPTRQSS